MDLLIIILNKKKTYFVMNEGVKKTTVTVDITKLKIVLLNQVTDLTPMKM